MYHRPTTFLLGAGASWHYGYPTGEELVNRVIFETANLEKFLNEGLRFHQLIFPQVFDEMSKIKKIQQNSSSLINEAFKNVEILKNSLKTGVPFSIDYFIGRNPSIAPIAKMLVAHVIMDCEKNWQATNQNRNRNDGSAGQDDWVRILVENLKRGCSRAFDLNRNRINFLTFNYDTSLEDRLKSLLLSDEIFDLENINHFLSGERIIHLYGKLPIDYTNQAIDYQKRMELEVSPEYNFYYKNCLKFDESFRASKSLRIVDPNERHAHEATFSKARDILQNTEELYILGYGFDQINNERIGLHNSLEFPCEKNVYFTNKDGQPKLDVIIGETLNGDRLTFSKGRDRIPTGNKMRNIVFHRSTQDVYRALQYDFP